MYDRVKSGEVNFGAEKDALAFAMVCGATKPYDQGQLHGRMKHGPLSK